MISVSHNIISYTENSNNQRVGKYIGWNHKLNIWVSSACTVNIPTFLYNLNV